MGRLFSIDFTIVPPEKAVVSVMDRGFLYGDSVYEVVRTYGGTKLFLADRHYGRLCRSAERIGLSIPFSYPELETHLKNCVDRVQNSDCYIRVVVSRGEDRRFHLLPTEDLKPKTVCLIDALPPIPQKFYTEGTDIALVATRRNLRQALDPNIKSGNYLNNMLAMIEAHRSGASDAVMLNHEGFVTEGTTSNVFIVTGGEIRTPPLESGLLEGITRGFLREIFRREKVSYQEIPISESEFRSADEIFLTGSIKEIMPVATVDGEKVGKGGVGPVTQRVMALFKQEVERA